MTGLSAAADAALEPLRHALRAEAGRRADELRATSERDAAKTVSAATENAKAIRSTAVAAGEAMGQDAADARSAQARRAARALVLEAQCEIATQWSRRARDAASALRDAPGYPDILARLTARARAALGPKAVVRESPRGGVTAEAGSRRLDLTLPTLADAAVAELQRTGAAPWRE